jgi:hypothetical protein
MTKLTDIQVKEIRRLFKTKTSKQKDMAEQYGVSLATINNIIARRAYKHIVDEEIEFNQDKPYSCRVKEGCDKCFKTSSLRSSHERLHTKPYKCSTCNIGYSTNDRKKFCERGHKHKENEDAIVLPDIFTLLDISDKDSCDEKTLRNKYKKAVLKYHPDKGGDNQMFIKIQSFKDKIYNLIDDDDMIIHYLDQNKKYTTYKTQKDIYDTQSTLRDEFADVTKRMNELRHLKGTVDEGFKELRRQQYKLKKIIVDKPSYYSREYGESNGFSWF